MTFAAGDGHEFPIYAGRFRITFPLLDADGDTVTGATTPDSEVSIDGGTFADCTNEMSEIATSSGIYRLDLTAAEMTGKTIAVQAKSATSGMKTTVMILNPKRPPILESGTAQAGAGSTITLASGASAKDGFYAGIYVQCSNNTPSNVQGQTRKIISYVGSTRVATVEAAWGTNPSSSTTYDLLVPGDNPSTMIWAGKRVVDPSTDGTPGVDAVRLSNTALTARDIGASVLLSAGTGTGQLDFTSGVVKANLAQILGTALTETAGLLAAGFKQFFNIASPTSTMNTITTVTTATTATNLANAPTSGDLTATMKASVTTAATAATPAAASVTGNVGGNVTGSIGSLGATAKSDVKTQVVDGLNTDTYAEPGQGAPGATITLAAKINYLYKAWRNKSTQTATTYSLFADDASTVDQKSTVSDDATTFTRGEVATGP